MEVLFGVMFLIAVALYWGYQKFVVGAVTYICPNCKSIGTAKSRCQGSFVVEVILWLLFIIPGLIYSAWRGSKKIRSCATCGFENLVPIDSPRGMELREGMSGQSDGYQKKTMNRTEAGERELIV